MLTFFRKIRKGLLEGGSTSKYLLYAIGEIALVVIGILIALQINNWNGVRIQNQIARGYAEALLAEVEENLEILERRTEHYRTETQETLRYIQKMNSPRAHMISRDSLIIMGGDMGPVSILTLVKSTYDDLISSGNLENFSNPQLRKIVMKMGRKFELIENNMQRSAQYWERLFDYYYKHSDVTDMMHEMVSKDIPKLGFEIDRSAFIHNRNFTNLLAARYVRYDSAERVSQSLKATLVELKSELESHLSE